MIHVSSRLAAHASIRQVLVSERADAAANAVDRAIGAVWQEFLRLLRVGAPVMPGIYRVLDGLVPAAQANLHVHLDDMARWVHRDTSKTLSKNVPLPYLQAATITRATEGRLLEAGFWQLQQTRGKVKSTDLLKPLSGLSDDEAREAFASALFPPPSESQVLGIMGTVLNGQKWYQALDASAKAAAFEPGSLAALVARDISQGKSQREVAKSVLPFVNGVRYRAKRVARTYGLAVAHDSQQAANDALADLIEGWQVHATLDQNTRPKHRERNGRIYYLHPQPGQAGLDQKPDPPREADGEVAWNCRCYVSPVLRPAEHILQDPSRMAVFRDRAGDVVPDPAVYSDWFAKATERQRRLAVGTRRYSMMADRLGRAPEYADFVDGHSGEVLPLQVLKQETPAERAIRTGRVDAIMRARRYMLQQTSTYGFMTPAPRPVTGTPIGPGAPKVLPMETSAVRIAEVPSVAPPPRDPWNSETLTINAKDVAKVLAKDERLETIHAFAASQVERESAAKLKGDTEFGKKYLETLQGRAQKLKEDLDEAERAGDLSRADVIRRDLAKTREAMPQIRRQVKELQARHDAAVARDKGMRQLLAAENHATLQPILDESNGSIPETLKAKIQQALDFLAGIVRAHRPGARDDAAFPIPFRVVPAKEKQRAYQLNGIVSLPANEDVSTVLHEIAHAIEEHYPQAAIAAQAFLAHRVKDEAKVKLKDRFPAAEYDSTEEGRGDEFAKATGSERLAYYAGKHYAHGGTEVFSIGIELLYADPVAFAKADPEWFKFVVGMLTGVIR